MKNVKIFFAIMMFAILFANHANAQETLSKEQKLELLKQYKENHARLNLTAAQQQPYKTIVRKYALKLKTLRENTFDKQVPIDSLKSLSNKKNGEMKLLLTPEQYQVYLDIQDERKERMLQAVENKL